MNPAPTTAPAAPPVDAELPDTMRAIVQDRYGAAAEVAPRRAALIAGAGYAALFLLAIFANFVVIEGMVVAGDPSATLTNIVADPGRFRLGLAAFLVIAIIDVVVAWALHVLLREVAADRSLVAAWLRVLHSVFLGVGLAFLYQVDHLVRTVGDGAATRATASQVMLAVDTFEAMWLVGLAFFGLHLLVVVSLLVGPRAAPRLLRVLLGVAGMAYVADTLAQTLMTDYDAVAGIMLVIVAVPSVLAEGWFGLWLLSRAARTVRAEGPSEG